MRAWMGKQGEGWKEGRGAWGSQGINARGHACAAGDKILGVPAFKL